LKFISGKARPLDETLEIGFFDINDLPNMAFDHDLEIISDWSNKRIK